MPVSWSNAVLRLSNKLNLEELIVFLYELRNQVHENRLHKIRRSDQVDPDVIRSIAEKVCIPPRLRYHGIGTSLSAGILTSLAVFPDLGSLSALAGGAVTISTSLWKGYLPSAIAKIRWFRCAIKWDEEKQVEISP